MWRASLHLLVVLGALAAALAVELAPDLQGPYCARRGRGGRGSRGGCCLGRIDECSVPILGTLCYCDTFCNRTSTGGTSDCCPDYTSHCLGLPPTPILLGCNFNGKFYNRGEVIRDNCNECKCVQKGLKPEMQCENHVCLIDPATNAVVNSGRLGWVAGNYSEFWGRTLADGRTLRLGTLHPSHAVMLMTSIRRSGPLPPSFDARDKWPGLVTGVQDQGWCGASWALSTAAVASDRFAIMSKGMETPRLSTQHLLDCNNNREQHGCQGGHLDRAWWFIRKFGLVPESCYPWTGTAGRCRVHKKLNLLTARCPLRKAGEKKTVLYRTGPAYRMEREEDIMHEIMLNGPVQATMQVYHDLFAYQRGVYRHAPSAEDERSGFHSVRIIGWGEENISSSPPTKYWLVANSWGNWWGENGLFRIQRGTNECHIEDFVLAAWADAITENKENPLIPQGAQGFPSHRRK